MKNIQMVLHDWNGCLLNDVPHRFEHGPCAIFRHYGLPKPDIMDYCQHITSDFMLWYYARGVPNSGDKKKDGDTLDAIMKAEMLTAPIPPLFPEAEAFLWNLRQVGIGQALVSALQESEFRRQIDHHRVQPFFLETHGGIRGKAKVFVEILSRHGIDPENAVGVTDTMSDAKELHACGVLPIIVPRGYSIPDPVAVPTLVVVNDLNDALKRIIG